MPDWRDDCRDARMANEAAGSSESESSALFFRWWFRPPRLDDGCGSANGGRERAAGERGERLELMIFMGRKSAVKKDGRLKPKRALPPA